MRPGAFGIGLITTGIVLLAVLGHVQLYRWLLRALPSLRRVRFALIALFVLLAALPLLRVMPITMLPSLRSIGPLAMIWHVVVVSSMLVTTTILGLVRLVDRARDRLGAKVSRNETTPDAVVDLPSSPERRQTLERFVGATALTVTGGAAGWGTFVGRRSFRVEELVVRIPRLPKTLDGFTIAQISDIHVGPFVGERELRRGLAFVTDLKPDLVAVTGDILDHDPSYIPLAARVLGALRAKYGVVAIPGNHDHYTGVDEVLSALSRAGVEVLMNRAKVIEGGLAILGVDDLAGRRGHGVGGPSLRRAKKDAPPDAATVLLAHQPPFFEEARREGGIDLQLSGHTHGGQINPGFVPARAFLRYIAGAYREEGSTLYVNRGFGTAGPPCRIGAPPEVTKVVLVSG